MKNTIGINQPKSGFFAAVKAMILVMFFSFSGASLNTVMAAEKTLTKEQTEARVSAIRDRVTEIQAMDMSKVSHAERMEIRNELKDMKKELRQHPQPYVYISGVTLILIIILLLILL